MSHHPTHQKTPTGPAFTRHGALDSGWLAKFRRHPYSRHRVGNPHARSAHGFPSSREPGRLHILLAAGKSLGRRKLWRRGGVAPPRVERVLKRTAKRHSQQPFWQKARGMSSIQTRPASLPISSAASVVLHGGFVVTGILTTLIGPILPILIGRWSLTDQRAGLFFTAQFCGSMAGVASLGWLIKRGYRHALVCGFSLIAAGVAGLNLGSYVGSLAAAAVFGCGLGQVLSATNLWVAEVAKTRRVAALSILNLMWGLGAIASSPLVMLAQRRGATAWLLYAIALGALFTALILAGMNLEPATTPGTTEEEQQRGPARSENI